MERREGLLPLFGGWRSLPVGAWLLEEERWLVVARRGALCPSGRGGWGRGGAVREIGLVLSTRTDYDGGGRTNLESEAAVELGAPTSWPLASPFLRVERRGRKKI